MFAGLWSDPKVRKTCKCVWVGVGVGVGVGVCTGIRATDKNSAFLTESAFGFWHTKPRGMTAFIKSQYTWVRTSTMCTQQYLAYAAWDVRDIVGSYYMYAAVCGVCHVGYCSRSGKPCQSGFCSLT